MKRTGIVFAASIMAISLFLGGCTTAAKETSEETTETEVTTTTTTEETTASETEESKSDDGVGDEKISGFVHGVSPYFLSDAASLSRI